MGPQAAQNKSAMPIAETVRLTDLASYQEGAVVSRTLISRPNLEKVVRMADLIFRGAPVFTSGSQSVAFIVENLLFLVPVLLLVNPGWQKDLRWLFVASSAVLLAGALYRFNAFLIGYLPGAGWHYFPAAQELMVTIGIVAFELMAYLYFVKRYPVLPGVEHA